MAVHAGKSWSEAMQRLDGSWYKNDVEFAVQRYQARYGIKPCDIEIDGFKTWLEQTGGK